MVSLRAMKIAMEMDEDGWTQVPLPRDSEHTPIPGLMLFSNERHDLIMVLSDGRRIDLLKVYSFATEAMRRGFHGDLIALTEALNGEPR